MTNEMNITAEEATGNLRAAMAQLADFQLPAGIIAGFSLSEAPAYIAEAIAQRDATAESIVQELMAEIDGLGDEAKAQLGEQYAQLAQGRVDGSTLSSIRSMIEVTKKATTAEIGHELHEQEARRERMARLGHTIDQAREQLKALGYFDEEYEADRKKKEAELADLPEGSAAYYAKQAEIAAMDKEHFASMRDEAVSRVDTLAIAAATSGYNAAAEKEELITTVRAAAQVAPIEATSRLAQETMVFHVPETTVATDDNVKGTTSPQTQAAAALSLTISFDIVTSGDTLSPAAVPGQRSGSAIALG